MSPLKSSLPSTTSPIEIALRVWLEMDDEDDWSAVVPALPDPLITKVKLTATDPEGLSASVEGLFRTDWESQPVLERAVTSGDVHKAYIRPGSCEDIARARAGSVHGERGRTGTALKRPSRSAVCL